jgi:hypothetical protein
VRLGSRGEIRFEKTRVRVSSVRRGLTGLYYLEVAPPGMGDWFGAGLRGVLTADVDAAASAARSVLRKQQVSMPNIDFVEVHGGDDCYYAYGLIR